MADPLTPEEEAELRDLMALAIDDATVGVDRLARLLATLDAARAVPAGLDVERLARDFARAMYAVDRMLAEGSPEATAALLDPADEPMRAEYAALIAREYAAAKENDHE